MSESLHNMDDLFKKALQENTDLPSESVWENIDKNLDKKNVVSILKKYNKLKWVAALLILFTSAMAIYTLHVRSVNRQLANDNDMMKQKNIENKKPGVNNKSTDSSTAGMGNTKNIKRENQHSQESRKDSLPLGLPSDVKSEKIPAVTRSTRPVINGQNEARNPLPAATQQSAKNQESAADGSKNQAAEKDHLQPKLTGKIVDKNSVALNNTIAENKIGRNENNITKAGKERVSETPQVENRFSIEPTKVKKISAGSLAANLADNVSPIASQPRLTILPDAEMLNEKNINYRPNGNRSTRLNFNKPTQFSLNIFYSPDISFKTVSNNNPMYRDEDRDEIRKEEWVKYASTVGINLNYDLKNNWQIGTGISYSTVSTEILPKIIYARPDNNGNFNYRMNCSAGYSYIDPDAAGSNYPRPGDSIRSLSSNNRLAYINVPLIVRHPFAKNRWNIAPSAGVSIGFLTKGQIETTIATNTGSKNAGTTTIQGLKKSYLSTTLSILGQYSLNKNLSISFEPTSRFGLGPINKDASVNTILNSIGFAAGLVIKL